jgi:hypothetical protein
MEQSELVCSISGCVIVLSELKAEWGALERVHAPPAALSSKKTPLQKTAIRAGNIHDMVELVVREVLDSPKTARCLAEETVRDQARRHSCLARLVRELAHNTATRKERPNLLHLEAQLSWQCRKSRALVHAPASLMNYFFFMCAAYFFIFVSGLFRGVAQSI